MRIDVRAMDYLQRLRVLNPKRSGGNMESAGISKLSFSKQINSFSLAELASLEPVRDPVRRYRGVRGKVGSLTGDRSYGAESQNELRALRILVACSGADFLLEQPFSLQYECAGQWLRYTPDVLLVRGGQYIVIEVKPDTAAKTSEMTAFFSLVARLFKQYGLDFKVWLQSEIEQEPRLANAVYLLNFRRERLNPVVRERLRRISNQHLAIPLKELSDQARVPCAGILRLVLEGHLHINWSEALNLNSTVSTSPIGPSIWPTQSGCAGENSFDVPGGGDE